MQNIEILVDCLREYLSCKDVPAYQKEGACEL